MRVNGKEYITMSLMVERSGKDPNAIKQWLFTHDIKPVSREALYEPSVLEELLSAGPKGRPKKEPIQKPKGKKTKK